MNRHLSEKRVKNRKMNNIKLDDNEGGITNLLVFVDDLTAIVSFEHSLFFVRNLRGSVNKLD